MASAGKTYVVRSVEADDGTDEVPYVYAYTLHGLITALAALPAGISAALPRFAQPAASPSAEMTSEQAAVADQRGEAALPGRDHHRLQDRRAGPTTTRTPTPAS